MQPVIAPVAARASHRRRNTLLGVIALLVALGVIGSVTGKPRPSPAPASVAPTVGNGTALASPPAVAPAAAATLATGSCLLSNDDVGRIAGQMPMSGGDGTNVGGLLTCVWLINLSPARDLIFQLLASDETYLPTSDSTNVPGLGDGAYWDGTVLNVKLHSGGWQMMSVTPVGLDKSEGVAQAVASLVLQRLH